MKSDLQDIEVIFVIQTDRAFGVKVDERATNIVWLPKSQCEIDGVMSAGRVVTLTASEGLLVEKGLV
jgi:hypothetical protein